MTKKIQVNGQFSLCSHTDTHNTDTRNWLSTETLVTLAYGNSIRWCLCDYHHYRRVLFASVQPESAIDGFGWVGVCPLLYYSDPHLARSW